MVSRTGQQWHLLSQRCADAPWLFSAPHLWTDMWSQASRGAEGFVSVSRDHVHLSLPFSLLNPSGGGVTQITDKIGRLQQRFLKGFIINRNFSLLKQFPESFNLTLNPAVLP